MKNLITVVLFMCCGYAVSATAQDSTSVFYVKANNLNVRDAPAGEVVGSLRRGTAVTFVDKQDRWVLVTDSVLGDKWVAIEYLCSGDRCWAK